MVVYYAQLHQILSAPPSPLWAGRLTSCLFFKNTYLPLQRLGAGKNKCPRARVSSSYVGRRPHSWKMQGNSQMLQRWSGRWEFVVSSSALRLGFLLWAGELIDVAVLEWNGSISSLQYRFTIRLLPDHRKSGSTISRSMAALYVLVGNDLRNEIFSHQIFMFE